MNIITLINLFLDYLLGCMIRFYISIAAILISPFILFLYIVGLVDLAANYKSDE